MNQSRNDFQPASTESIIARLRTVRRGYSPEDVRESLERFQTNLTESNRTISELKQRLAEVTAELNDANSRPEPIPLPMDEAMAAKMLGDHVSFIISNSVTASQSIKEKAEAEGAELLSQAKREKEEASTLASQMLSQAQNQSEQMISSAQAEARSETEKVQSQADELLSQAKREKEEASTLASQMLSRARDKTADIITSAQAEAKTKIDQADQIIAERLGAQELLAKEILDRANQLASETISNSQRSADRILADAQKEATSLLTSARETRTEILSDLKIRADEVRGHIDTLARTRGWFLELLQDAQRRVTSVESALTVSINSNLESLEGSVEALNLYSVETHSSAQADKISIESQSIEVESASGTNREVSIEPAGHLSNENHPRNDHSEVESKNTSIEQDPATSSDSAPLKEVEIDLTSSPDAIISVDEEDIQQSRASAPIAEDPVDESTKTSEPPAKTTRSTTRTSTTRRPPRTPRVQEASTPPSE
ncbi:coiled-coil domain-containing protein [Acidithrix ferrooxidans]|uniref:DivIVA protein n=1 Tax=Acidithrix ferrooxidans TaxID=1280514 RepID=A0A0D8HM23_9ACTN|nr:ATP synthase F0 subunit B [Acidithrix ferrooxidans]KJF18879.1 DivIVA protein [Acidithrix ferrooxidans]